MTGRLLAHAACIVWLSVVWLSVVCLSACATTRLATAPEPSPVPSSHRDPAPYFPPPSAAAQTGAPVGLMISGGEDQARQVLVTLVLAMRDGDEAQIARMLAERVGHAGGAARTTWPRGSMAHQLAVGPGTTHVDPDATFESLVDPATIRVAQASTHFANGLPSTVTATDLVVVFQPTAAGRRALAGLSGGVIVVRPGPEAIIVAR